MLLVLNNYCFNEENKQAHVTVNSIYAFYSYIINMRVLYFIKKLSNQV